MVPKESGSFVQFRGGSILYRERECPGNIQNIAVLDDPPCQPNPTWGPETPAKLKPGNMSFQQYIMWGGVEWVEGGATPVTVKGVKVPTGPGVLLLPLKL
jgi:hypothetical protein